MLDKYAVVCGGGFNHRLDLSDGVLIKNNHIALAGGIVPALEHAVRNRRGSQIIEVEVRTMEELELALTHGGEAIRNMIVEDITKPSMMAELNTLPSFSEHCSTSSNNIPRS